VGREVARRARAFGTGVLYHDEVRREDAKHELGATYATLPELLSRADIVSVHVPLTPLTRRLIGGEELAMMKPAAVLVNVARGGIVDERELAKALLSGRIAGAALDVWESEPVPPDNPLLRLENVIATPHVGAGTRETLSRVLGMAFANIQRVSQGETPHHVVNGVKPNPAQEEREYL
jgi:glyoxylate reductase